MSPSLALSKARLMAMSCTAHWAAFWQHSSFALSLCYTRSLSKCAQLHLDNFKCFFLWSYCFILYSYTDIWALSHLLSKTISATSYRSHRSLVFIVVVWLFDYVFPWLAQYLVQSTVKARLWFGNIIRWTHPFQFSKYI